MSKSALYQTIAVGSGFFTYTLGFAKMNILTPTECFAFGTVFILMAVLRNRIESRTNKKRGKFSKEYSDFRNSFIDFFEFLENSEFNLNAELLAEFKRHKRAKDIFTHNLKGSILKKFDKKWAEYEKEYNTVANLDVYSRFAAIAPSQEALKKATPLDAEQWNLDRKKKIHKIIAELLEISKRN